MRKKIEEGLVPITKENIPQFLKSRLDNISADIEHIFPKNSAKVKITQTNVLTRITFQFKGPVNSRFENLKSLYKEICHKEIQSTE